MHREQTGSNFPVLGGQFDLCSLLQEDMMFGILFSETISVTIQAKQDKWYRTYSTTRQLILGLCPDPPTASLGQCAKILDDHIMWRSLCTISETGSFYIQSTNKLNRNEHLHKPEQGLRSRASFFVIETFIKLKWSSGVVTQGRKREMLSICSQL